MDPAITAIRRFFSREVRRLPRTYGWKIPQIEGFAQAGQRGYQANLNLKKHLKVQWEEATSLERRFQLARIIVSDWGGVRANNPETLSRYVAAISEQEPQTPLRGVASYSKIFSIVRPHQYAIYDARVAACLNAIQINAGLRRGVAFNYVPGRNKIVGNVVTKRGFTQKSRFSIRNLVQSGWRLIERDQTYGQYLETLSLCLAEMQDCNLASLEMALFANAEKECQRAMAL